MCSTRAWTVRDPDDPLSGYSGECQDSIQRCMYHWFDERCDMRENRCEKSDEMWAWDTSEGFRGVRWHNYRTFHLDKTIGERGLE